MLSLSRPPGSPDARPSRPRIRSSALAGRRPAERSQVRHADAREALFDLDRVIASLRTGNSASESLELLLKTRSNLLRLWAED